MSLSHRPFTQGLFLLLSALLLSTLANTTWAAVGQFQFVSGDVRIVAPDGKARQAQKGGEINEGESIVSAKGATAQLRMTDGGILAIRQETEMHIDEYRFNGEEDGSERSFFSLLKGGFRSITGKVGKLHKENYRIKTPAATIGIRGTDSETIHVTAETEQLSRVPAGTYNKVNTGSTLVNGTLVSPNQVAYTPNLNTAAILLPAMPPIFEAPKSQGKAAAQKSDKDADAEKSEEKAPPPPEKHAAKLENAVLPPRPQPTSTLVGANTSDNGTYPAPNGYGGVASDISWRTECLGTTCFTGLLSGAGSMVQGSNNNRTILLNASGFPVMIADKNAFDGMQYTAGTATLLDFGQTAVAGTTVRWGRYVGTDAFVDHSGTRDPLVMNQMWAESALNYTQARAAVTNMTGPVNFSLVNGAGTVTDELNNMYHLTNGNLKMSAGGTDIQLNLTTDTVANRSWDLTYKSSSAALSQFYYETGTGGLAGLPLVEGSIKVNGSVVQAGIKGDAGGVLIGSGATGVLTSFTANVAPARELPSGAALSGTALLTR